MKKESFVAVRALLQGDPPTTAQAVTIQELIHPAVPEGDNVPDCLWTKAQTARAFAVTPRTIETWAKTGKLSPVRHGRRCVRFLRSQVMVAMAVTEVANG